MDKELLIKYRNRGLTQRQIAEATGKSQTTIRYWLKKYQIFSGKLSKEKLCNTCGETNQHVFSGRMKSRCGYNKFAGVLQFHHKAPTKKSFGIASSNLSLDRLRQEAAKC